MTRTTKQPWLIPIGGFLGAGKTTLILAAAKALSRRGLKCAAILNDQGAELVDTALVRKHGIEAGEVTGACFCCQFSELIDAAEELRKLQPDVIFAEPVGSCTDLSATILQPLKRDFRDTYRVAPLTVLVDPARAAELRDENIDFLFERQLAEADLVAFTKCDLYTDFPELPASEIRYLSARTGQGVDAWLDEILDGSLPAGSKLLEIDYDQYARAEAALGWLNWSVKLRLENALSPAQIVGPLMDRVQTALSAANLQIVHLKVLDQTPSSYLKAAITANEGEPNVEGDLTASPELEHELRVNLRAVSGPDRLRKLFEQETALVPGLREQERLDCFSPGAPKPEFRLQEVVSA